MTHISDNSPGMSNRDAAIMKILVLPLIALTAASLSSRMEWLIVPSLVAIGLGIGILLAILLMRRFGGE